MGTPPSLKTRAARRSHGRATLADVAAAAGVTSITVSRYLREPHRVAADTAQKVALALAATGYLPNKQAGVLASGGAGASRMVAALIPSIANSIFAETVQGLAETLQGSGCELLLAATNYSTAREEAQLRALMGWFPSAIVVTGRRHSDGALALLRQAQARGAPVIEIWDHHANQNQQERGFTQIGFDHAEVGRAMAAHLIERGHKTLAYLDSGVAEDFRAHERGQGFLAEARRRRVAARRIVAPLAGEAIQAGREALPLLLGAHGKPAFTAVAFANDHLACGALLAAQALRVAVPRDLALLGFGDFALGRQLAPTLSTVQVPRLEIGKAAAQALLAALDGGTAAAGQRLPWALLPRAST
jgi:LacI family transcriptional regulator, gluconate utilization system Gnt-I transcriptional repressor